MPRRGFTLIELLVVLAIIAVLLTLAVPRYFNQIDGAKETVLRENLQVTRVAIDKYFGDLGRYPDSLDELVERRYLRSLPFHHRAGNQLTHLANSAKGIGDSAPLIRRGCQLQ